MTVAATLWDDVGTVALTTLTVYLAVVVLLRVAGKRTLASLNAFDLVVTIALGTAVATAAISAGDRTLRSAVVLVSLVGLQWLISWSNRRFRRTERFVKARPRALVSGGVIDTDALRRERVTVDEVRQAVRKQGIGSVGDVDAVVLETDGTLSVIGDVGDGSALADVARADPHLGSAR